MGPNVRKRRCLYWRARRTIVTRATSLNGESILEMDPSERGIGLFLGFSIDGATGRGGMNS